MEEERARGGSLGLKREDEVVVRVWTVGVVVAAMAEWEKRKKKRGKSDDDIDIVGETEMGKRGVRRE